MLAVAATWPERALRSAAAAPVLLEERLDGLDDDESWKTLKAFRETLAGVPFDGSRPSCAPGPREWVLMNDSGRTSSPRLRC